MSRLEGDEALIFYRATDREEESLFSEIESGLKKRRIKNEFPRRIRRGNSTKKGME